MIVSINNELYFGQKKRKKLNNFFKNESGRVSKNNNVGKKEGRGESSVRRGEGEIQSNVKISNTPIFFERTPRSLIFILRGFFAIAFLELRKGRKLLFLQA